MTAHIQSDCDTDLLERRTAYEAEVVDALLDESAEERAERLALVEIAQAMILRAFQVAAQECDA
ncbi:MAG TPA: hypothetical protein VGN32_15590 [Ktedonobacterales bacterium]|jgi:hypothetical protein|nr:hypothetical protein [Ktedonobacterales bacterium]